MQTDRSHIVLILGVVLGSTCLLAGCGAETQRSISPEQEQQPAAKNPLTPEPVHRQDADPGDLTRPPDETPAPPDDLTRLPDEIPPPPDDLTHLPDETPAPPSDLTRLPDETPPPPGEETAAGDLRPLRSESPLAPDRLEASPPMAPPPEPNPLRSGPAMIRFQPAARDPEPAARDPEPAARDPQPDERPPEPTVAEAPPPVAAVPPRAAAPEEQQGDYTVVKVYYGTDRAIEGASDSGGPAFVGWLVWTACTAGLAMVLAAVAFRFYRTRLMRILAATAVVATGIMGVVTARAGLQTAMTAWQANPPKLAYGNKRGEKLHLGTCQVSIPRDHQVGEVESPSILRLEFREDPERHVVLLDVVSQPAEEFYADLKACVGQSQQKDAFVFVHGFNVTFEDAARRTAQIAYDVKFEGAPIFYSWPSQGALLGYSVDEATVEVTVRHLKQFLSDVAARSGARQVSLIAHSMGNRALTSALRDLSFLPEETRPEFREVILTAPDIDADLFQSDIAPAIVKTARRVTLYASSNDRALAYSKTVHGYPRAGDSGRQLLVLPGIDTIDVSAVDTSLLGHSYYGSNDTVLADLFDLLHEGKSPDQRKWLSPQEFGAMKYWIFQRNESTASRDPAVPAGADGSIR